MSWLDDRGLRCVSCGQRWSTQCARAGETCGVRLSGTEWCGGVFELIPIEPLHQPPRDLSAVHPVRGADGRRVDE